MDIDAKLKKLVRHRLSDYRFMQERFYKLSYDLTKELYTATNPVVLEYLQQVVTYILQSLSEEQLIPKLIEVHETSRANKVVQGLVIMDANAIKDPAGV